MTTDESRDFEDADTLSPVPKSAQKDEHERGYAEAWTDVQQHIDVIRDREATLRTEVDFERTERVDWQRTALALESDAVCPDRDYCAADADDWPCPTIHALDGDDATSGQGGAQ